MPFYNFKVIVIKQAKINRVKMKIKKKSLTFKIKYSKIKINFNHIKKIIYKQINLK